MGFGACGDDPVNVALLLVQIVDGFGGCPVVAALRGAFPDMRLLSDDVQGVAPHVSGGVASLVGPVFGERRLHVVLAVAMQVGVTVFFDEIPVA